MLYSVAPDFSIENWKSDTQGTTSKDPLITPSEIKEICLFSGMSKFDLSQAIRNDCGCSITTSYRHIKKATKSKAILFRKSDKLYFPT
jgi:hypothetical protein